MARPRHAKRVGVMANEIFDSDDRNYVI